MQTYNGISAEYFFLTLTGLLVGVLWLMLGIYLRYGKHKVERVFVMQFYLIGVGLQLLLNPAVINIRHNLTFSLFLSFVGIVFFIVAGVSYFTWLTVGDSNVRDVLTESV